MPSDLAASIWPLSTETIPARMISLMYAPSLTLERDDAGDGGVGDRPEAEVQRRPAEREVDVEDLDEQRRAAEDPDVDGRDPAQRSEARHAGKRREEPQEDSRRLGDDRDVDRRPEDVKRTLFGWKICSQMTCQSTATSTCIWQQLPTWFFSANWLACHFARIVFIFPFR